MKKYSMEQEVQRLENVLSYEKEIRIQKKSGIIYEQQKLQQYILNLFFRGPCSVTEPIFLI